MITFEFLEPVPELIWGINLSPSLCSATQAVPPWNLVCSCQLTTWTSWPRREIYSNISLAGPSCTVGFPYVGPSSRSVGQGLGQVTVGLRRDHGIWSPTSLRHQSAGRTTADSLLTLPVLNFTRKKIPQNCSVYSMELALEGCCFAQHVRARGHRKFRRDPGSIFTNNGSRLTPPLRVKNIPK